MLDRNQIFFSKADCDEQRLRTKWGNGGTYLVKYPHSQFDKENFEIESKISQLLPEYIPETRISFNRLIRTYLVGNTLNQVSDFEFYLYKSVKSLQKLHEINTTGFGVLNEKLEGFHKSWAAYLDTNFQKHVIYCHQNLKDFPKIDVLGAFYARILKIPKFKPCLLHGDPSGENMIVSKGSVWLIDFECALSGDSLYEWAFLATFYPAYAAQILKWLNLEESKTFWFYFLRISVAKLVSLHKKGVQDFTKGMNRIKMSLEKLCQL